MLRFSSDARCCARWPTRILSPPRSPCPTSKPFARATRALSRAPARCARAPARRPPRMARSRPVPRVTAPRVVAPRSFLSAGLLCTVHCAHASHARGPSKTLNPKPQTLNPKPPANGTAKGQAPAWRSCVSYDAGFCLTCVRAHVSAPSSSAPCSPGPQTMPALRLRGGQADGGGPGGAGMPAGLPGMPPGNYFSKVLYIVTLYRRRTWALTCENVWQASTWRR